jgi:hypothetical protein
MVLVLERFTLNPFLLSTTCTSVSEAAATARPRTRHQRENFPGRETTNTEESGVCLCVSGWGSRSTFVECFPVAADSAPLPSRFWSPQRDVPTRQFLGCDVQRAGPGTPRSSHPLPGSTYLTRIVWFAGLCSCSLLPVLCTRIPVVGAPPGSNRGGAAHTRLRCPLPSGGQIHQTCVLELC